MTEKHYSDDFLDSRGRILKRSILAAVIALAANLAMPSKVEAQSFWTFVEPAAPPYEEKCYPPAGFIDPKPYLLQDKNTGRQTGRLIWPLSDSTISHLSGNPYQRKVETTLSLSAAAFALARLPKVTLKPAPLRPFPSKPQPIHILQGGFELLPKKDTVDIKSSRIELATVFADLAVTGRRLHGDYKKSPPTEVALVELVKTMLKGVAGVGAEDITQGAKQALARAKQVDAYLSAVIPNPKARAKLGWIGVSAEDDQPYRPCNIPSLPYPQYNIAVPVSAPGGTVTVDTRFAIISKKKQPSKEPSIPKGDVVLLFIHGDSSRLEEVEPLIELLHKAGERHGVSYTIIALDLPSHGYTTMVDPHGAAFKGSPTWGKGVPVSRPPNYPVLEFLERFIVSFVATLDKKTGVAKQLLGPMGGSLGGNLSLRLARRNEPWIKQSIAWSPACLWASCADDIFRAVAPNHCSDFGHRAETGEARGDYFYDQFEASANILFINIVQPQGEYWYRKNWPCKKAFIDAGKKERREIYTRIFRQWHYRMDWEQLVYSFRDQDGGRGDPRWKSFRSRLLLAGGKEDTGGDLYNRAKDLGEFLKQSKTRGRTFYIEDTGHSIHDERPKLWAAQIDAFCAETLGGGRYWIKSGNPRLVRFTGDLHDWTTDIPTTGADVGKPVLQFNLTIKTGDDDLRGGSNDNVDVILNLQGNRSITFPNINRGKNWGNGSTYTVPLFLPSSPPVKIENVKSLTLRTRFRGGFDGDNWNIDQVILNGVVGRSKGP